MSKLISVDSKIKPYNKEIQVSGDKSISIRWVLFSSLASGISTAKNLLMSEDVLAAIKTIKKFGIKVKFNNGVCKVHGKGMNGYKYKNNLTLNAENSGTLGRLLLGLIINSPNVIKLTGDKSLSRRDFKRVTDPLSKFGAIFKLKNKKNLENYQNAGKIYVSNIEKILETFLSIFDLIKLSLSYKKDNEVQHNHNLINEEVNLDERV